MKNIFILLVFLVLGLNTQAIKSDSLLFIWNDQTQEDTVRLNVLNVFINNDFVISQPDSAIYYAHIQYNFAKQKGLDKYRADALNILGRGYMHKGQFSEAINSHQSAYELYEKVGNRKNGARALHEIGQVKWLAGEYETAKEYYQESMVIANEIGDTARVATCLNSIAYCYFQQGHFTEAMQRVNQSLKLNEEIGDDKGIAWGLNALGVFYTKQGEYDKALKYYFRAIEVNEKIGDRTSKSLCLGNIGEIYFKLGDNIKALEFLDKSLLISEKLNYRRGKTFTLSNKGRVLQAIYEMKKAMECFQSSLSLAKEAGNVDMQCEFLLDIGLLHIVQENYTLGISECQKSYEIAQEVGSLDAQLDACACLYRGYKALGRYDKALKFHEKMLALEDSINIELLAEKLKQMEFQDKMVADSLATAEEKLKTELAHQTELHKKDRIKNIFIISGLFLLLIAGGLWARISYIRKANAQLKKEKARAESSELFKHQFLANMSHEIRTPMNAIKGMSDILIRRNPNKEQLKYLSGIKESSNSLLVIINDILDLSKIEEGKIDLELIPFSLNEIVKNVDTIMQFKAEEKGLELKSNISNNIPHVIGDPSRLQQVIINLVGNAIKFTERGIVTTSLTIVEEQNSLEITAHFVISDTGIGIEENQLEQVFNSFEQAYSDTSRKYGGTGLGLSISKKLIELQNGKIWAESKKGMGSQFHFTIPYRVSAGEENAEVAPVQSGAESIDSQLKGVSVLLVEDNHFNAVVAREELEDAIEDTEVVVAENGAIAVEQVRHSQFDVVLMDVQMPVMNGFEATKAIRALEGEKSKIPIIAMTANVLKEEVELCFKAGMNDFIGKPFETEVLTQKIVNLIQK